MKSLVGAVSLALLFAGIAFTQDPGHRAKAAAMPEALKGEMEALKAANAVDFGQDIPDEMRQQLVQALGGGVFIVFRDKVQEELKLSDEQKQKLLEHFPDYVQATAQVFEKIQDAKPDDREKQMQEHRQKSEAKLTLLLKDVLQDKQRARLFQLQLQQAGVFALLGENEAFKPLRITEAQRKTFMDVVQDMQKKIHATIQEAGKEPNPEEILPRVMKIRTEHEGKIEALLSERQKKEWKALLGKPFDLGD